MTVGKCLVLCNSFKKDAPQIASDIKCFLEQEGVACDVFAYNGREADRTETKPDAHFEGYDLVVTLGGDGTVLFASRYCAVLGIPVFPINLGEFGFLAPVQPALWKEQLKDYLEGRACTCERHLVTAEIIREGKTFSVMNAMNDVVISSYPGAHLTDLKVAYNRAVLGPFKSNGLIVSTATGSTAYSAAEGGPIVDPALKALVLTPISSFSLSARPLVFGGDGEIAITVMSGRTDVNLTADGQESIKLLTGDVVILGVPEYRAKLVSATQENFYAALQSKLNWSGGPHA